MAIKKRTTIETDRFVIVVKEFDEQQQNLRLHVYRKKNKNIVIEDAIMCGEKYRIYYEACTPERKNQLQKLMSQVRADVRETIKWSEYWEEYEEN